MTQWYYEDAGKAHGPVTEADLTTLLADGLLPPTTRVWHEGFGREWRTAAETSLIAPPAAATIPPPLLSPAAPPPRTAAQHEPPAAPAHPATAILSQTDASTTAYRPRYATWLAAVPLLIMACEIVALAFGVEPTDPALERGVFLWTVILSFWFAHRDAKAISTAGLNPNGKTMVPFVLLTQIGYFLRRRSVAGLSLTPLWQWLGAVVVYTIFSVATAA